MDSKQLEKIVRDDLKDALIKLNEKRAVFRAELKEFVSMSGSDESMESGYAISLMNSMSRRPAQIETLKGEVSYLKGFLYMITGKKVRSTNHKAKP